MYRNSATTLGLKTLQPATFIWRPILYHGQIRHHTCRIHDHVCLNGIISSERSKVYRQEGHQVVSRGRKQRACPNATKNTTVVCKQRGCPDRILLCKQRRCLERVLVWKQRGCNAYLSVCFWSGMMADVHVVMMPYPSAGHSAPFVHLAKHLGRSGVAVSFIAPDAEIDTFKGLLYGDHNITVVPFAFPVHQEHMDAEYFFYIGDWMQSNADTFEEILVRLPGPPVCIISDMFLGFTQGLAEKLGIPRYCLYSSPAPFLSFTFHLPQFDSQGRLGEDEPFLIPNYPPILPAHLPPFQLGPSKSVKSFFVEEAKPLWRAAGVIVNSVYEIDAQVIQGLRTYLTEHSPHKEVPTIMTMGPLLGGLWEGDASFRENPTREACFDWLDQQREASVLYVCFGSIAMPSPAQVRELAVALERSERPFFWVLRTKDLTEVDLPEGFLARTNSRGVVYTEWAPQLHILAHRAVGGFLSHCGWNSALEGMIMGVPMIVMPMFGDQMVNATLLVKVLGVAIRVNEVAGLLETVRSETIAEAVRTLITDAEMRSRAAQVAATIQQSVRPGGSSYENLALFLRHLHSLKSIHNRADTVVR